MYTVHDIVYWRSLRRPDSTIVGLLLNLMEPLPEPVASRALTTSSDWVSMTSPKTTWRPSSQLVVTVVMKNCEPLLWRGG